MHLNNGRGFRGRGVSKVRSNSASDFRIYKQGRLAEARCTKHLIHLAKTFKGELDDVRRIFCQNIRCHLFPIGYLWTHCAPVHGPRWINRPKSNRINASHSAAFLFISSSLANNSSETSAADARYPVHRRDLTFPFEWTYVPAFIHRWYLTMICRTRTG